jgi:hypothetical protein
MNTPHPAPVAIRVSRWIVLILCMFLAPEISFSADSTSAAAPVAATNTLTTRDSASKASAMARDSVAKAANDILELAANQRKELINTVLEVIGSVLAIVIILFFTWKMSSGGSKPAPPKAPAKSSSPNPNPDESHQDVMQRRMKMAKK